MGFGFQECQVHVKGELIMMFIYASKDPDHPIYNDLN